MSIETNGAVQSWRQDQARILALNNCFSSSRQQFVRQGNAKERQREEESLYDRGRTGKDWKGQEMIGQKTELAGKGATTQPGPHWPYITSRLSRLSCCCAAADCWRLFASWWLLCGLNPCILANNSDPLYAHKGYHGAALMWPWNNQLSKPTQTTQT